ncbi:hypothetical protein SIID45300_01151 [Candidatus Magnetaquicoccaceae bacterium FCR-1]|uniref:Uncharacterized protein n=1 Tax=Candidatus Magnetaquiglobus chichijimensis TaxID=3141448 RepID=A0ABQ0C7H6_9PROT
MSWCVERTVSRRDGSHDRHTPLRAWWLAPAQRRRGRLDFATLRAWWLALALLLLPAPHAEAEPQTAPPRELLGQIVNIDRPEFKAKGRIALHRLNPLAGQLILSESRGDPEWIFKTITPWNPRLAAFLKELKIEDLALTETDLLLDGPRIDWKVAEMAIPEGRVEQLIHRQEEGGLWNLSARNLRLERLPKGLQGVVVSLAPGAMGFDRLEASGDRERGSGHATGVFGQGWRMTRLEGSGEVTGRDGQGRPSRGGFTWKGSGVRAPGLASAAKKVPELAELLRFAGRNPGSKEPVDLGKIDLRVESDGQGLFTIKKIDLNAPWIQLAGDGALEMKGGAGGKDQLRLNLLAKRPDGDTKRFKITLPVATLVKP